MKRRPRFRGMPDSQRITDILDWIIDQLSRRSAFPDFDPTIQLEPIKFEIFNLVFEEAATNTAGSINIEFKFQENYNYMKYKQKNNGCEASIRQCTADNKEREIKKLVRDGDFVNMAIEFIKLLISNRDSTYKSMEWKLQKNRKIPSFLTKFQSILRKLGGNMKVEELEIDCQNNANNMLRILPLLDSESLKRFELERHEDSVDVKKLKILQKFKNLEWLKMADAPKLPVEVWWNVPDTKLKLDHVKLKDMKRIMENFLQSRKFKGSFLLTPLDDWDIAKTMGWRFTYRGYHQVFVMGARTQVTIRIWKGTVKFT